MICCFKLFLVLDPAPPNVAGTTGHNQSPRRFPGFNRRCRPVAQHTGSRRRLGITRGHPTCNGSPVVLHRAHTHRSSPQTGPPSVTDAEVYPHVGNDSYRFLDVGKDCVLRLVYSGLADLRSDLKGNAPCVFWATDEVGTGQYVYK